MTSPVAQLSQEYLFAGRPLCKVLVYATAHRPICLSVYISIYLYLHNTIYNVHQQQVTQAEQQVHKVTLTVQLVSLVLECEIVLTTTKQKILINFEKFCID